MLYLYFIGNPASCNGKALKIWPSLEKAIQSQNWPYEMHWSEYPGHSRTWVQDAIRKKPTMLIAIGGDGTVHEIIDEYYKNKTQNEIIITAFPLGTGNDWARYWKIPFDINEWIRMIQIGNVHDHDLGEIEYTTDEGTKTVSMFNNVAGMAYDAFVAHYVEDKKKKAKVNAIVYLFYIFRCLFMYRLQKSILIYENRKLEDKFYTINIGLCPYSGGGLQIVPHARPDLGKFAVTAVKPLNKFGVLLFSKEFYSGKMHLHKKVISFHTDTIQVIPADYEEIIKLEADGEILGRLPASFRCIPKAIKICAP